MTAFAGVSLGCGNFGGIGSAAEFFGQGIAHDEAFAIMDRAWGAGIHWFDTADAYGGGTSERWIGEWMRERDVRPRLTTKVFHSTVGNPDDVGLEPARIRRQLEASLKRFGVEQVDLYLAHEPDERVPLADTIGCFEALRAEGLVGAWGLSNYDVAGIREALAHGSPSLVQNSFSLLEREDEDEVLPLCAEHGVAYIPFGPLAGGWLAGRYRRDEPFPTGSRMTQRPGPYESYVNGEVFDRLEAFEREAGRRRVDVAALAFAWVLARCDGAVCGPNRAAQLDPVLAARELRLADEDVETIGGLFS